MRHPKFGRKPSEKRMELIKKSPNYKNGKFQNLHDTPQLTEGHNMAGVMYKFLFKRNKRGKPVSPVATVKTDLNAIPKDLDVLVWFGHSSYFMQIEGKTFLVDPVFSGNASPLKGTNKAFAGADIYKTNDLPHIDYLMITHDHYDHLDYDTVLQLREQVDTVICGLGVGEHLEYWGFDPDKIIERDWNETIELENGFKVHTCPTRHFSGRSFSRNVTLWVSYLLETPSLKIYIGGDSGYDEHFSEIGKKFGPIDLAILDNGQYDPAWKYIHMQPAEVLKAGKDLNARRIFPVHSGKFTMANHAWDEPLKTVTELNRSSKLTLITPKIGELVELKNAQQSFTEWWKDLK